MALDSAETSLLEEGVFLLEDSNIGRGVDEFEGKGFPFQTEEGIDFWGANTLGHKYIKGILESYFVRSSLGLLKAYGPKRDTVFSFMTNPSSESNEVTEGKDKAKALIVQLLPRDSVIVFYRRSHLHSLRARGAKIGLLEVPQEALEREDIAPLEVTMKEGGFAIIDGRLGFKIVKGIMIVAAFAVKEELKYWNKMKLPKETRLMQKIEDMTSEKISINVDFVA